MTGLYKDLNKKSPSLMNCASMTDNGFIQNDIEFMFVNNNG